MHRSRHLLNVYDPAFMRKVKRTLNAYSASMDHTPKKGVSREAFVDVDERGAAWYLGHMQSATTALLEKVKDADFVLEIRDARLPFTTENPMLRKLASRKPHLIVFNKAELSNEEFNRSIQDYYESNGAYALFTSAKRTWRDVVDAVQRFATHVLPPQNFRTSAYVGLVVGMPNVGKSTLINALRLAHEHEFHREDFRRSRTPEAVSITPGTTRALKLVPLCKDPNIVLYDSPGLTLPGNFAKESGLKLAACGIIPLNDVSLPRAVVARFIYDALISAGCAEHMAECLHLARVPISFDDCISLICERSGTSGQTDMGNLDPSRAQRFLIHDFQLGNLGKITLDPLPRRFKRPHIDQHQALITDGEVEDNHGAQHGPSRAAPHQEDFVVTHHVQTTDVVDRYPDHMKEVLEALRGTPSVVTSRLDSSTSSDDSVISRRRGPISRSSARDAAVQRNTKLAHNR